MEAVGYLPVHRYAQSRESKENRTGLDKSKVDGKTDRPNEHEGVKEASCGCLGWFL